MSLRTTKAMREHLRREQASHPLRLQPVPKPWPITDTNPKRIEVWRSRRFLVQVFRESFGLLRLSINRAEVKGSRWEDGITWDELQQIKREIGRGDFDAVEIFPRDQDVVNVANMRHLWVFTEAQIPFAWRREGQR